MDNFANGLIIDSLSLCNFIFRSVLQSIIIMRKFCDDIINKLWRFENKPLTSCHCIDAAHFDKGRLAFHTYSWSKFYFAMCFGTSTFNRWVTWLMGSDSYVLLWNVWSEVEKHRSFFFSVSLSLDLSNYEWGYWQAEGKYDDSSRWFYFLPVCYLAMANISIISDANISYL